MNCFGNLRVDVQESLNGWNTAHHADSVAVGCSLLVGQLRRAHVGERGRALVRVSVSNFVVLLLVPGGQGAVELRPVWCGARIGAKLLLNLQLPLDRLLHLRDLLSCLSLEVAVVVRHNQELVVQDSLSNDILEGVVDAGRECLILLFVPLGFLVGPLNKQPWPVKLGLLKKELVVPPLSSLPLLLRFIYLVEIGALFDTNTNFCMACHCSAAFRMVELPVDSCRHNLMGYIYELLSLMFTGSDF